MSLTDNQYMMRAIELAKQAVGRVSPNPPVGAVLVKDGRIVGEGWTQPPGGPHAEIVAIQQAGDAARGATLYVTLEPCSHHGRTPPCADAVIASGIAQVHVAVRDPNPKVDGRGFELLRNAGLEVRIADGPPEACQLIEAFAKHVTTGIPFVVAKFAMSLDGKIATRLGDSRWISNEASRRIAHQLRAEADAVMVGIRTALADDPRLTVRDAPLLAPREPLRVVVDSTARLPPNAAMLREPGETLVALAHAPIERRAALEAAGAELLDFPAPDGQVDLPAVLGVLGARKATSVLVEGGAHLLGALFDARLVDKVVAFIAPVVVGGLEAPTAVAGRGIERMADALRLTNVSFQQVEGDILVTGYPEGRPMGEHLCLQA